VTKSNRPEVTAVVLTMGDRDEMLRLVLARLSALPVAEVLVVDNSEQSGVEELARAWPRVRVLRPGRNVGVAARNLAAREAAHGFLLMLEDDAYPLPGAVEALLDAMEADPGLAVAGGLVRDVDGEGRVTLVDEVGTFDWFLRAGRSVEVPAEGLPVDFFAEGCSLIRRDPFLEVGGFFEPYFFTVSEVDLTTRLLAAGWDVRYFPAAAFDHMKPEGHGEGSKLSLRYRVRNNAWYFWLRFPAAQAAWRIPAYGLFDLIECSYRRMPGAWFRGMWEAWRERGSVRAHRDPVPRALISRVEINRGRLHLRLLVEGLRKRLLGRPAATRRSTPGVRG